MAHPEEHFRPPHGLGRKAPDPQDRRDRILFATIPNVDSLPSKVDNESVLPPAQDQGAVGSCCAWSGGHVAYAVMVRDGHARVYLPSPPAMYLWCRELDEPGDPGATTRDEGTYVRNYWKVANKRGLPDIALCKPRFDRIDIADETTSVFDPKSRWRMLPSKTAEKQAATRQAIAYFRLPTIEDVLKSLADGYPVQIGFTVYRSFYDAHGNPVAEVVMPKPGDRELGGHAVTLFGYDMPSRAFFVRNQWGATAHQGSPNFRMPFDFFDSESDDRWTCRTVEGFGRKKS